MENKDNDISDLQQSLDQRFIDYTDNIISEIKKVSNRLDNLQHNYWLLPTLLRRALYLNDILSEWIRTCVLYTPEFKHGLEYLRAISEKINAIVMRIKSKEDERERFVVYNEAARGIPRSISQLEDNAFDLAVRGKIPLNVAIDVIREAYKKHLNTSAVKQQSDPSLLSVSAIEEASKKENDNDNRKTSYRGIALIIQIEGEIHPEKRIDFKNVTSLKTRLKEFGITRDNQYVSFRRNIHHLEKDKRIKWIPIQKANTANTVGLTEAVEYFERKNLVKARTEASTNLITFTDNLKKGNPHKANRK